MEWPFLFVFGRSLSSRCIYRMIHDRGYSGFEINCRSASD
jgi:hypothetical protein